MRKRTHKKRPSSSINFIFTAVVLFVILVIGYRLFKMHHPSPPKDIVLIKKTVKVLPPEIKKELKHASPSATFRVPILLYHYVEYVRDRKDTIRQSLSINSYVFEKQLQTLQDAGYTFMTTGQLSGVLDGKTSLPEKPVILTFDDGYRDFYTDAYPLLKKYNAHATAYIVPGFLNALNYMDKDQLEEIARDGLVEIGAHTVHHVYLKNAPLSRVEYEALESKKLLEDELHIPIVSFAYPYGAFDKQAIEVVKTANFKTAVSTVPGIEASQANRFFLFRIRPGGRTGDYLLRFLEQTAFKPY